MNTETLTPIEQFAAAVAEEHSLARGVKTQEIAMLERAMHRVFQVTPTVEQIERIETEILKFPQLQIEPIHHFSDGVYAREILIPAGALLTGKIHRTDTLNVVIKGEMSVWTQDGFRRVKAPCTFTSRAGLKRIGIAHTDTLWLAINANPDNCRDVARLDEILLSNAAKSREIEKNDRGFSEFLSKAGLTDEAVWQAMRELPTPVPNPAVDSVFVLAPSPIHGVGMFAARRVSKGEVFPLCRGALRYNLARYVNHSDAPNAIADYRGDGAEMTVLTDLAEGEEVTMNYADNRSKTLTASAARS